MLGSEEYRSILGSSVGRKTVRKSANVVLKSGRMHRSPFAEWPVAIVIHYQVLRNPPKNRQYSSL